MLVKQIPYSFQCYSHFSTVLHVIQKLSINLIDLFYGHTTSFQRQYDVIDIESTLKQRRVSKG